VSERSRRVWVTRTLPAAMATADRLVAMGLTPVVAPVLEARPITGAHVDLTAVDALAFTSCYAVRAFRGLTSDRTLPVFAVGDETAARARAAGFAVVVSAEGDAAALAELIARAAPRPGRVLIPVARVPAADLAALLASHGVDAVTALIYETAPTAARAPPSDIDAVLVHSPRAGSLVAEALAGRCEAARIDGYAISPAAAAPLRAAGLRSLGIAARPTEAALLALLGA
jgi:uroporphyrinogen-III synthase